MAKEIGALEIQVKNRLTRKSQLALNILDVYISKTQRALDIIKQLKTKIHLTGLRNKIEYISPVKEKGTYFSTKFK